MSRPLALPAPETLAARIRRLQKEARTLARDHVTSLGAQLHAVQLVAAEIADGGEAYPPGIRELCRTLVNDLDDRQQTLEAIRSRTL